MAGVIDEKGQQWERCSKCREFHKIEDLGYLRPTKEHPNGLDLCVKCVDAGLRADSWKFGQIQPAKGWKRVHVKR